MKRKKVTIRDIARELDVTASTVSRALRDHPRISTATKEAVWEMAEKLNYHPNNIAAALRKGKSNIIGVMVPTSDRNFFASVIRGIEEVIREEGYNLIICQSDDQHAKEGKNIDALLKIRVDGIIASVAKETRDFRHFHKIQKQGVPLVLYDRVSEAFRVSRVCSDDHHGAYRAVEHLIEQGCRRIAHIAGSQHLGIYRNRKAGYHQALRDHGLPVDDNLVVEHDLISSWEKVVELGRTAAGRMIQCNPRPDAIFSASDFAAMGAIQLLKERGVGVPEEISVVGYSNDPSCRFIDPGLTSVDQHTKLMGNRAAELFLQQVNRPEEGIAPEISVVEPELIVRNSSLRNQT